MALIKTPFGFASTAAEVVANVDLTGKSAIVTGGASGIGIEAARALALAGARVTLAVRQVEAARKVAAEIAASTHNSNVMVEPLDLSDLTSVLAFSDKWKEPLHILINNAGIMALPQLEHTAQGWEAQFATNFLGHFALTLGLYPALARAQGARVVSVSSSANMISPVNFDDPHFNFLPYDPFVAYGQSKTACSLFAVELTRRWAAQGIYANALNPGAIATNLQKHTGGLKTPPERRKSPQQGAATSVLLATSPLLEGIGGRFFDNCNEALTVARRPTDFSGGVAPYALDPDNARRLWELSLELITEASISAPAGF
jgi:NAD(P)-dependent dehydrogenase (short-subunit alcohol dehydrogenase family)